MVDVCAVDIDTLRVTQITDLGASSGMVDAMSWHQAGGLAFGYTELDTPPASSRPSRLMTVAAAKVAAAVHGTSRVGKG